ncbi:MAG: BlaI/MecI/CopY family transcriptional regulator [Bryobacteraceae bacterium]
MRRDDLPKPTDSELEILRVLWNRGPSTVRDVFDTLNESKPTGYTTVLKLMQIMADKKLVRRNEEQRAHVYEAQLPEEQTQNQLLGDLLHRAFGGSASRLVMRALSSAKTSKQELVEIRRMIDEMEDRAK